MGQVLGAASGFAGVFITGAAGPCHANREACGQLPARRRLSLASVATTAVLTAFAARLRGLLVVLCERAGAVLAALPPRLCGALAVICEVAGRVVVTTLTVLAALLSGLRRTLTVLGKVAGIGFVVLCHAFYLSWLVAAVAMADATGDNR